jgi:hypothetical protein
MKDIQLHECAMLVSLNMSVWLGHRYDKKATKEVDVTHGASDAGRYNKLLVDKKYTDPIMKVASKARNYLYSCTIPWNDYGMRLLPSSAYFDFVEKMRSLSAEFETEVSAFINKYASGSVHAWASARLGSLYDKTEYPSVESIKNRYSFRLAFFPVPESSQFTQLFRKDPNTGEELESDLDDYLNLAMRASVDYAWNKMASIAQTLSSRFTDEDARFKHSLITSSLETIEHLKHMNLRDSLVYSGDLTYLERYLTGLDIDKLRTDKNYRAFAAIEAGKLYDDIMCHGEFLKGVEDDSDT